MENQQTIECLMELIPILSKNLKKSFYGFKFNGNSVRFKTFDSLDDPSLVRDLKNAISFWNSISSSVELNINFHLDIEDHNITLTW